MPGAARRTYPARTSNRWLGTSASAGSSRRVRRNSVDKRVITAGLLGSALHVQTGAGLPGKAARGKPRGLVTDRVNGGEPRPAAIGSEMLPGHDVVADGDEAG